jgi:hypothetical protein
MALDYEFTGDMEAMGGFGYINGTRNTTITLS